ncbi:NAD(P)/FAD-dependent oxidoreductase [Polymorphobacter sp.]|uniref:NAD(P)/FAD-dependent oxidoreductase n=1 Tax=Polymorphobacter sp. TaxID=1909290 RepID=UPI003F6EBACE
MIHTDIAIIGAGIAGASLGWALRQRGADVLLIEAEDRPGYHTTGRSAAFWVASYGGPAIVPLSLASRGFLTAPPEGFGTLLAPRPGLYLAPPDDAAALELLKAEMDEGGVDYQRLGPDDLARWTMLRPEWQTAGLWEGDSYDIDVAALHQGYLRGLKLVTDARVQSAVRAGGKWRLETGAETIEARVVVNAAGAWADPVGAVFGSKAKGLQPLRRSMVVLRTDPEPPTDMPVVFDAAGRFYFKPDGGRVWLSPHDETPDVAHDVRPDEMDIAVVIDRFEKATNFRIIRLETSWAGLRTFAPDRRPVLGWDGEVAGLFWCAGQGGFGIQTAPAVSDLCARILTQETENAGIYDAARAL